MTTTTTTNATENTITIGRRTFSVEAIERAVTGGPRKGTTEIQYILRGARGATYGTMRNYNQPALMALVNGRGFGMAPGFDGVWLTDVNGRLEVVRGMYR